MFGETWLGLTDLAVEGDFVWEKDGSAVNWTQWLTAPNADGSDCTKMKTNFEWDVKGCTENREYACENGTGAMGDCVIVF